MENKKNYFKDLFYNVHFIIALLLTSISMTFIVACYNFNITGAIFRSKHVLALIVLMFVLFAIVFLPYLCFNLKSKKITIADSLYLTLVLLGVVFFLYSALTERQFSIYQLAFNVLAIALGFAFIVLRMHFYYTDAEEFKFVAKNKISKYYFAIFSKFHYIAVVVISGLAILLSYFLTDSTTLSIIKHPKTLIVCLICAYPIIVYALTKINSKTITVFDCLGVAAILALPLILVKFVILSYSPLKVIAWAIVFAIYIVYLLIRYNSFDANAKVRVTEKKNDYFATLVAKYDIGLIFSVGGLIAIFSSLLIDGDLLHPLYAHAKFSISASLLPTIILAGFTFLALVFFVLVCAIGLKKKGVCIVDLFLSFCLSFVLFGLISLISHPSLILLALLLAFLVFAVIILAIRVKANDDKPLHKALFAKIKSIDVHGNLNPVVAISLFLAVVIVAVLIGVAVI